jgi:3-oxoacyl-[acyl-carrier protein] reductase
MEGCGVGIDLNGQVAVVTGGASGIGRAVSEALGAAGAKVLLTYFQSDQGAAETVAAIGEAGSEAEAVRADLALEADAALVAARAVERFGGIDILVANSGGLLRRSPVAECTLELWQAALNVNLTSTFLACRAVLPHMQRRGKGCIVTVSSLAAHDGGGQGAAHYAAAKGGVLTFTKALAKEAAPSGIRVNGVAPGLIATQFHDRFSTPEGRKAVVGRTPLGREGTPEDVAGAVLYLVSPMASFLAGETIEVNGGQGLF